MAGVHETHSSGRRQGGGSRLHITWNRRGKTVFGKLLVGMFALTRGILIRRSFQMGLTRMAATQADPDPAPSQGTGATHTPHDSNDP